MLTFSFVMKIKTSIFYVLKLIFFDKRNFIKYNYGIEI